MVGLSILRLNGGKKGKIMNTTTELSAQTAACWRAIYERDNRFDGLFVFGVRSTGIYCRPSCPAKKPLRKHVLFFDTPQQAERKGFRPCKRCHPQSQIQPNAQKIRQVCGYIEAHLDEPLTLAQLGKQVGFSPHHLQRVFKQALGVSPKQYADACRLGSFQDKLRRGDAVTSAVYAAGYGSSSRVYGRTAARLGMTPATYGKGGKGLEISYVIVDSPLGRLLVAATEKGVCKVSLGDSDADLQADLQRHYHAATLRQGESGFQAWVIAIVAYLKGRRTTLALPIDVRATAFQWQVWEALQKIPYGSTRSYAEVAASLGRPKAARAVANACANNPVALVTPCHRVVRGDGSLGGYRWGLARKRALLELER